MLLRNLNQLMGLCNGTRLNIIQLINRIIEDQIINSNSENDMIFIPRIKIIINKSKWLFSLKMR